MLHVVDLAFARVTRQDPENSAANLLGTDRVVVTESVPDVIQKILFVAFLGAFH